MPRTYLRTLALFYLAFGLITSFYPRLMQLFMTQQGVDASSAFSDQVWFHGGFDILSICILLFAFSTMPATKTSLRAAATVALFPSVAIAYTFVATPFWSALFLLPGAASFAFAVFGFAIAHRLEDHAGSQRGRPGSSFSSESKPAG